MTGDRVVDPRDLIVTYGETRLGDTRGYVLAPRDALRRRGQAVFQSDRKGDVIAEAQRLKGFDPVDGREETYARQVVEAGGEAR